MTQRDFSKPVRWWCPRCGLTKNDWGYSAQLCDGHDGTLHIDGAKIHQWTPCIPVFAEIPEGDRPATHEPDDDTVTISRPFAPFDRGDADLWFSLGPLGPVEGNTRVAMARGDGTLGVAVLWVAEGRR